MLKQKLPIAAVRQRMEADGVSPAVVDAFFTGGASREVQNLDDPPAATSLDMGKFVTMLRVGMGDGAVRQRMEAAGVAREDMNAFFSVHAHDK